jgi:hypothetical protein
LSLSLDKRSKVRAETSFRDQVDPSRKDTLELFDQRETVGKAPIGSHVDQQVDVAVFAFLAPRD